MNLTINDILAKSFNYGGLTLIEHTRHVMQSIEHFAHAYGFDVTLARKGALLHDLGKAHPHFQRKIQGINARTLNDERERNLPHRHELSSLAFLACFPRDEWDVLIELVVGHHKAIENDPSGRGILDLANNNRHWIQYHIKDWDEWSTYGFDVLRHFGVDVVPVTIEEARKALEYVFEYCDSVEYGWAPLRGLLMSADHFASAFTSSTADQLPRLFEIPNITYYESPTRANVLYPLSEIDSDDKRPHTLVVAPTGAGKTDFLLRRCRGRIFYTLPFQASINAMFERLQNTVGGDIRLLHATSKVVVGNEVTEHILQPMAGASVKVLTPHQLASIIFGTRGFEMVMLDVKGCDVILDEVHTYSDFSRAMVLEIVKALLRLDCHIHIGTATMPSLLYNELLSLLGGANVSYEVKLSQSQLNTFDRHRIYKLDHQEEVVSILNNAFVAEEKVLYICNTVREAQRAYVQFKEIFQDVSMMLIHSRYRRQDRVRLETSLKNEFNMQSIHRPCLVVATQVVEVSLDISFDRMITFCAPLDSMIQRFGRVNRIRTTNTIGKYKPIHVIAPAGSARPYRMEVLKSSYDELPNQGEVLREKDIQGKIDHVFTDLDSKTIDTHLIFREGEFVLRKLCDNRKAVLLEALEIESATCILECDREAYLAASYQDRIGMEIPVNFRTIALYRSQYPQLEVGSNPFVVPQREEDHMILGLEFVEQEIFI